MAALPVNVGRDAVGNPIMTIVRRPPLESRYLQVQRTLDPALLTDDDDASLERDILELLEDKEEHLLLGFYSREGLMLAFEAYGFIDEWRLRGYGDFSLEFELTDLCHRFILRGDGLRICECRLRRLQGASDPCIAVLQREWTPELLYVEWLQLEDPRAEFTARRPQLPGQQRPGSGLGEEFYLLLKMAARRLQLDGIIEIPERLHNAVFYARVAHFIDPAVEGRFLALAELIRHQSLHRVAWAMERGKVVDGDGRPIHWDPREQLVPLGRRLERYFESPAWRRARGHARRAFHAHLVE